jgi:hypothetical protein
MKPRFRKTADGRFVKLTEEDIHRAKTHELKARNHLTAAAQILGEEPATAAAPRPTAAPTPARDESMVNLPESARICGLTDAQLRKFWENDPTFPGPKPYTQLWRRWQIIEWNRRRLNP